MELCRKLREQEKYRKLPIVMLTARVSLDDRIQGLDFGADDYITKPFAPNELVARIKAVLRRAQWETFNKVLNIDPGLRIDFNKFEVYIDDKRADLTLTEFKILQLLTKRPGWVYNRQQILDFLWGNDKIVIDRTVDVHVKHLREKLGRFAHFIRNIRGVGYKFETEADTAKDDKAESHD
jgi:two-component system phosphate regulon response regulator PhoB/two-component system alkaline phosphatase synthesis response regulator PhoP